MRATADRSTSYRPAKTTTTPVNAPASAAVSSWLIRHCRWELMAQPRRPLPRR